MYSIILQDSLNNEVTRVFAAGNENYLPQKNDSVYPYLSELSDSSFDVFSQQDMVGLVEELKTLKKSVIEDDQRKHIAEIINIAIQCLNKPNYKVCFTPFFQSRG
ncbi:hypothetical protein TDB9533_01326 [Thalassocella blandensis]|nr:hypothetical protein TDB9533_01326 [Thalassocella blandensis]